MRLLRPFIIILLIVIAISCQKELDDGNNGVSKGILVKDAGGNCSLANSAGTYKAGKILNDTNRLEATINVTVAGTYTIRTDTINGYYFKATGRFTTTGMQTVRLSGYGTPLASGTNNFTIIYDNSVCSVAITVQPVAPPGVFTLAGAPNGCTNATLSGNFTQGILFDTSSTVTITLNVTVPGSFSIATNTVNGYSFAGTGLLTATGVQTVRLRALGTPVNVSTDIFIVTAGSTSCTFPVTVLMPVAVSADDYFPITMGSYWVYNDLFNAGDSLRRDIIDSVVTNGNLYKRMRQQQPYSTQQYLFRKEGSTYLEYGQISKHTISFTYSPALENDLLFLKTNTTTGAIWQSPEYSGAASFGQTIILRYNYICEQANTTVTINGNTFANVHKILMYPEIKSVGNAWGGTNEIYLYSYAKGIGLIYYKKLNSGFTTNEMAIRRWQVN